jgi:molybdopterin-guanine dinucleotide biosynthesis protein A
MGAHKPLMPFAGGTLLEAVVARAAPQVDRLAVDVPPSLAKDYPHDNVLPDLFDETLGPLCGIVTGLAWLKADLLATFPCDTPFLPHDLVAQLAKHRVPVTVRGMPVCGLWPKRALAALREELQAHGGIRRAIAALGGREIDIDAPEHAFFNVNSRQDLQEAERLCAQADAASRPR